ncbi:methyltransferase [Sphingomonas sp. SRS2]|uniref:methyltransferase n=1 Tax=Sphingomonas sp. SRS2 TaxID=133190 RepID=UPI000618413B|nr:class I SAM-dependent methyltransferase [Sphingomonas sp. SRS2]KKC25762.1 methyltransferase [Sphingomonas sp. SRS2]
MTAHQRHRPPEDMALLALLAQLKSRGYHFVTPTPASHARVVARVDRRVARSLRDILGWSLPFEPSLPDPAILATLDGAGAIESVGGGLLHSRVRVSSLQNELFLHSAYPTDARDAVFFGPDSYRFADLICAELGRRPPNHGAHIVDIGTGAGVGMVAAARICPGASLTMTDINPKALRLAELNLASAGLRARAVLSGDLTCITDPIDIALVNPPYIFDAAGRDYRDGGGMHGGSVALDMARGAVNRLAPGGRLILYTGSAIVDGEDRLGRALADLASETGCALRYREIDPDIFGEELDQPAYADVERIAVISAIFDR